MANTIDFILTNSAAELMQKVISGKTLNFTRMAVGDGFSYDTTVAKGYTTLVNEVLSLDITKQETLSPSSVKFTSAFKNTDAQKEFYYREVGLFAQDPDTGKEILYAYGNRNDAAELITPAGSNIVTKQLIFIIFVGDSANVTFNVNADVYALQEDMLDVQENLEQIQTNLGKAQTNITNLQSGLNQTNTNVTTLQTNLGKSNTNITTLQTDLGKANTNITNLQSGKANKNLVNTGMITNCLLEVPQRIKYELTNGILTIKAGSVVIVPYGLEDLTGSFPVGSIFLSTKHKVVDTKYNNNTFFIWIELAENITVTEQTTESGVERWMFYDFVNKNLGSQRNATSNTTGNPSNTDGLLCYRTDLNKVLLYSGANILGQTCSLPLLIVKSNGSYVHENVVQVFNGIGYIGSTVWVDKGVKGLIPNGKNPDGTLNNIEWEQTSLYVRTLSTTDDNYDAIFGLNGAELSRNRDIRITYNPDSNFNLMNGAPWLHTMCGTFTQTAGVVSNFKVKKPIQIMDYNDYLKKISELETRITRLEGTTSI